MLQNGFYAHESQDGSSFSARLKRFYSPNGWRSWTTGENLLYNSAEMSVDEAIQAWMESPHHRDNILNPNWRDVGIASLYAPTAGGTFGNEPTWIITMDFGARSGVLKAAKPAVKKKPVRLTASAKKA